MGATEPEVAAALAAADAAAAKEVPVAALANVATSEGFRRKNSNLRKRNQKTQIDPAVSAHSVSCVQATSNSEPDGTRRNGRHLVLVGGTDRDRLALRSVAAAALGMLDIADIESAKAILRAFLRHDQGD